MATVHEMPAPTWTLPRLRQHFGNIPAERILLRPRPGTATEKELLKANERDGLSELIDGCLVEKTRVALESLLAMVIVFHLQRYLQTYPLGVVLGPDGTLRLRPGLVLVPDVSLLLWETMAVDEFPEQAIPDFYPDLAVEVISNGNTHKEMKRKLEEYFASGTRIGWLVYPKKKQIDVYHSPADKQTYRNSDVVDASELLPGFTLSLADLFSSTRRRRSQP